MRQHRERVHHFINIPRPADSIVSELKGIEKGKARYARSLCGVVLIVSHVRRRCHKNDF